jgi:DNA polymerase-1
MDKKAIVIDGNSLIYRSYYATLNQLAYYEKHNLPPHNALKLTMLIILKLLTQEQYDYALVAFDHGKKTLRHDTYAEYKAGRKPMPEHLVYQLPLIKQAIEIIGIKQISLEGIEADDIIGWFSGVMNKNNIQVEIFSSDKDLLQLVNERTNVNLFKTGISDIHKVTITNFGEMFHGLSPNQVTDFKGISGDSSDNLSGVSGIGPKTASELIKKFGSLENIYNNLDQLSESQKIKFINNKDNAIMCKQLSTIQSDININLTIDNFIKKPIDKNILAQ